MFENLTEKLQDAFKKISGKGKLTEKNVSDALREVRLALLEADVSYKVVRQFINDVKEKSLGQEVLGSLTPELQIAKILGDELTNLMGKSAEPINISSSGVTVLMIVGLQGGGKTTSSAKLALKFKSEGKNPLLVACDIYRPAAIKQLQILGEQITVPVFSMGTEVSPTEIAKSGLGHAKKSGHDLVIIDTAGRLHIDTTLMTELKQIRSIVKPSEILLVVDSMTGQDAINVAETFNDELDITGVLLTKLDGDARGGAALSIRSVTQKPIKLVSIGEKVDLATLQEFHPDRMADRILGKGDFKTLVDRAESIFSEDEAEALQKKMTSKKGMDFNDLLNQLEQIKKMGPLDQLIEMIPGANQLLPKGVQPDEDQLKYVKAVIQSMTPHERNNPQVLDRSRRVRIAKGSGTNIRLINQLIQQLKMMNRMVRQQSMAMPELGIGLPNKVQKKRRSRSKRRKRKRR